MTYWSPEWRICSSTRSLAFISRNHLLSGPARASLRPFVRCGKDGVGQPLAERWIVAELLEKFGVVGQQIRNDPLKRLIVLDAGVLPVGVLLRVLVGFIGRYLRRYLLSDHLPDFVSVFPVDVAKLLIERLDDVAQAVQFRFRL